VQVNQLTARGSGIDGEPRASAARKHSEAIMASLIIITVVLTVAGILFGAYLKICFAIRQEDRIRGSLRSRATSLSAQSARTLVGMSGSRWDQAGPS
jgi:hypothetical protein